MGAGHHHDHAHGMTGKRLRTAFLLTMVILAVELVGGILSHSLALLSDAGHVLTDIFALGLAWFATAQAERPADARKTYGYHRTGILAALANAITLILIVLFIVYEAIGRFQHPEKVTPWLMFVSAAVGIGVNLYIAFGFRKEGGENLNLRVAMLHVLGDVGASVGVIVGGLVILATGWNPADPLISLFIAVLIARGAWSILGETVGILMEATPRGVDVAQLARDVVAVPRVTDVHDLHVWSIAGGMSALSAHVQVEDDCALSACDGLVAQVNQLLASRYKIGHSTLQFEYACCDRHAPDDLYCGGMGGEEAEHDHAHTVDGVHAVSRGGNGQ
ncbi:MAG TPA: cation diffusion facilitator family transporter [Chloroflexota bacterium]|nr:cation diffusion facilitator family transporter [Chloroflexota bacterium]